MKIQKAGIAFISFILSVLSEAEIETLPGGLVIGDVVQWTKDYWNFVKTGHHTASKMSQRFGDTCYNEKKYTNAITGRLIQVIPQISSQLAGISEIMNERDLNLNEQIRQLKLEIVIHDRLSQLVDKMGAIDSLYDELTANVPTKRIMEYNGASHCDFAARQLYNNPLSQQIDAIYKIVVSSQLMLAAPWLAAILEKLQPHHDTLCGTGHSTLDYLHSIYASLIIVELKAYVMTAFSHNILFNFDGTGPRCTYGQNPDEEMSKAQKKLYRHMLDYYKIFSEHMEKASREFRTCDRGDHTRDETFLELEGAVQTIVHFPLFWMGALLNETPAGNICTFLGNDLSSSALYCHNELQFCTTPVARNCLGTNHECWMSGNWIRGCIAPKGSSRRYEWLEDAYYSDPPPKQKKCPEDMKMSIWRPQPGVQSCFCNCIDNTVYSQSTHIFNLRWVESDVSENMVITGIRFIVKHRVMQFQIQQGKLAPNFRVEEPKWKPVEDISEAIRASRLNKQLRGEWPDLVENKDYLIVSAEDAINFDTLNVSYPNVLTGVKFYHRPGNPDGHRRIEIAIKGTKFDHITGKLCEDCESETVTSTIPHEMWYSYDFSNPTQPFFPTKPASSPGDYAVITPSHMQTDSGQTTLPLFDALSLVTSPSAPISGLGIFHKASLQFTGFVSLKFLSLDYPMYMKESADELEKEGE